MNEDNWLDVRALLRFWRQSGADIGATAREFGADEQQLREALAGESPVRRKLGRGDEWDEDSIAQEQLQVARIRRRLGLNLPEG